MAAAKGFVLSEKSQPVRELIGDTWRARSLIGILARKEFLVRYRRAMFGLAWAAAIPLLQAGVLAFVVSRFVTFDSGGSYVAFVLSGTVPWAAFNAIVSTGATSIVEGAALSSKIYFPRLALPLVATVAASYGLVISVLSILVVCVVTGVHLGPAIVLLVPASVLVLVLGASFAVLLSALHVYFRDVRYFVQAALLVWLYITPVIYPLERIGSARPYVMANPVTGVVELFRRATVGVEPGWEWTILWTLAWCVVLVSVGLALHRRYDRLFVDLL